ncbi:MAG: hypothetical protein L0287_25975 [Anaerolineae bacterium]|nr:hypothetical protein [Anaerolineae bacterium]
MAVKRHKQSKSKRRRFHQAVKGGPFRLRKKHPPADAVPPVEDAMPHNRSVGVLRFDAEHLHLPEALAEAGENEPDGMAPGRVVVVITGLAMVFIAIIAWFVSQMPEK